jgi:hypothetical protein
MFPTIEERRVKDHSKTRFTTEAIVHKLREANVLLGLMGSTPI